MALTITPSLTPQAWNAPASSPSPTKSTPAISSAPAVQSSPTPSTSTVQSNADKLAAIKAANQARLSGASTPSSVDQ